MALAQASLRFVKLIRLSICELDFTADDSHDAMRLQNFRLGDFHDVIREHGEVGEFTGLD